MKLIKVFVLNFVALALCSTFFIGCASKPKVVSESYLKMDEAIVQGKLENGMAYYVTENSEPKNRIVLRLVVKAGSNMEEEDQRGVAHFIEHLAFNGTENFEKSAIVDYFEKIGMDFGSDLNAYTSFDETVYKLEIPADDPEILKTALLILHDWASAITFPEEEIEKERGVVTEEWRLRQGLQGRTNDKVIPLLLKDSQYEKRQPIGDMDVIHNISRERIMDFYKTWYRPDFMAIVAVGDINKSDLEKAVVEAMAPIPSANSKLEHPDFKVLPQNKKNISMLLDVEQKYEVIQLFQQKFDFEPIFTEKDVVKKLVLGIAREIFNARLAEKTNSADSKWLEAFATELNYTHNSSFEYQGVVPKAGNFVEGFKDFLDEYDRFVMFGATKSEVERMKTAYLSSFEQYYKNKDKINSSNKADSLIKHVLTGETVISVEDDYRISCKAVSEISVEAVNAIIRKYFVNRGTLMLVQAPADADDVPSENEIMEIWENYKSEADLQAYEEDEGELKIMDKPTEKGRILSGNYIPEMDIHEYEFENGIKVITKKTDFVENEIKMQAISKGGFFTLDDKDYPSAKFSENYRMLSGINELSYNQFLKLISTKNLSFDFGINQNTEYFTGSAAKEDFECLLSICNQIFSDFKFTDEGWEIVKSNLDETAKVHGTQPRDVYVDKIYQILFGDDIFYAPMDEKFVAKIDKQKAKETFISRFKNPADFTFIFIGDFDEEKLLDDVSTYIGTLETSDEKEETKYRFYDFPKGIVQETVYKGLDKQGQVYIGFGGKAPECKKGNIEQKYYDEFMASELNSLLNIWLREAIREDKSGCYGIGAFGGIEGETERTFEFEINFGCDPDRSEELTAEVMSQIKKIQSQGIPEDYIEKIKETLRRTRETNLRNNDWWFVRITQQVVLETQPMWVSQDVEKIISWITPESLQEQAKKYLNTDNYVSVFLKPEN